MTTMLAQLDALRNAIHDDSSTQTWSTTNYGQNQKVYVGIDERNPPESSDCPLVHLFPMGKVDGMDLEEKERSFGAVCVLYDDDTVTQARANVVEKEAVRNLLSFVDLIVDAINGVSLGEYTINAMDTEFDTIESFPFILASIEFRLVKPYYQGESDYFE